MEIKPWKKIGRKELLKEGWKKAMCSQKFQNPESEEIVKRSFFDSPVTAVVILPVTRDSMVIAIKQFRFAAGKIVLELPAGGANPNESWQEAGNRELEEETGYTAQQVVKLTDEMIFADPCFCTWGFMPLLGLDCIGSKEQEFEHNERIEVAQIPLEEWLRIACGGKTQSGFALTTTLLALPHLNIDIRKFKSE